VGADEVAVVMTEANYTLKKVTIARPGAEPVVKNY
jgi:hypothetical protein